MTFSGGLVFWLLVGLAAVAVVAYFERLLDLRRAQIDWQDFLKGVVNVLDSGNTDEALAICEDTPAPVAQLLGTVIGFMKTVAAANAGAIVARADLMSGAMQALSSAALGLAVAIPVAVMYGSLRVRLDRTIVNLEAAASQITGYISAQKEKAR